MIKKNNLHNVSLSQKDRLSIQQNFDKKLYSTKIRTVLNGMHGLLNLFLISVKHQKHQRIRRKGGTTKRSVSKNERRQNRMQNELLIQVQL